MTTSSTPPPSASAKGDAIDRLVKKLAARPLWTNGTSPKLNLPKTAATAEVVRKVFQSVSFDPGPVKRHRIIEARDVRIGSEPKPYTAVLVETDLGKKIVLIRYESPAVGWWSRVYD